MVEAITSFLDAMDGKQRLLLGLLLLFSCSLVFLFLADGLLAAVLLGLIFLGALWITKAVWSPAESNRTKIATASLALVGSIAAGYFKLAIHTKYDLVGGISFSPRISPQKFDWGVASLLLFALVAIAIINYLNRASPSIGMRRYPADPRLREKTFSDRLAGFCRTMAAELNNIHTDTNWSAEWFVPVEAEVEISSGGRRSRRLRDMLTAIRLNKRDQLFVVLGDPGAGKSVALRVLCELLLRETINKKGNVPLYINLKEWMPERAWTPTNPPTLGDLQEFVVKNLKRRLGAFGSDFIDNFYDRMLENGLFFVVFDSFDEIPALLDVDDSSWLIGALSEVFNLFFFGYTESRGVLASRYFRRPRMATSRQVCTMEIRPFTERKIRDSFVNAQTNPSIANSIFRERPDLVPLARNPFTAGLIIDFLKQPPHNLPESQPQMYESCIHRRLGLVRDELHASGLTDEAVVQYAIEIARLIFEAPEVGLEISVQLIQRGMLDPRVVDPDARVRAAQRISDAIDILVAARIGRKGGGAGLGRFSFVHRRFNEYFFVRHLLARGGLPPLDAIPLDSKWRDALVLYAGICAEPAAEYIANYCWREMQSAALIGGDERRFLRHVHCLRFLNDAFHSRTPVLSGFISELFAHIEETVERHESLLIRKIAVESVGLLPPKQIEPVIRTALSLGSYWISETAFNACRYIAQLTSPLEARLAYFLSQFSSPEFWSRYSEIRFSLELSPGMQRLRIFWRARLFDLVLYYAAALAAIILVNFAALIALIAHISGRTIIRSRRRRQHSEEELPPLWSLTVFRGGLFFGCITSALFVINGTWPADEPGISFIVLSLTDSEYWAAAIIFFLAVFFIPWYAVSFWGHQFRKRISNALRSFINALRQMETRERVLLCIIFLGLMGAYGALIWFIESRDYGYMVASITYWALISASVALALTVGWISIRRWIFPGIVDFWIRRNAVISEPLERRKIEETLSHLALMESRMAYLRALYQSGIRPVGKWSSGHPPNFDYDESGSFLARLEARWLGIER